MTWHSLWAVHHAAKKAMETPVQRLCLASRDATTGEVCLLQKLCLCISQEVAVVPAWKVTAALHLSKGSSCPSISDFEKIISERMKGTSLRKSCLGPFKALKMLWCANEAVKDLIKKRMKHMITASISQDGQGATVGVRMCIISLDSGGSVEIQSISAWQKHITNSRTVLYYVSMPASHAI